jgi:ABC-type tungstate transport system substrate-binding protein
MKLLKHRSFQVLFILTLYLATASVLPLGVHQAFYTLSLFIKDILLWLLPLTVGFFIAHAIASFEKKSPSLYFSPLPLRRPLEC